MTLHKGNRFDVIVSKCWRRDDGMQASLYGSVPWVSDAERAQWQIVERGYTIEDKREGTIGMCQPPFESLADAKAFAQRCEARMNPKGLHYG